MDPNSPTTDTAMPRAMGLNRWRAAGIHLLLSAGIAIVAIVLMLKVWYPPPLFTAEGGNDLLFILVGVDVILGPLITLIIFKSGKPGLRFDLTMIAVFQVCALVYGCYVMFVARPVYIAFVVDQFEIVRATELDPADVARARYPQFRSLPVSGPAVIAVDIPTDKAVLKNLLSDAMNNGTVVQHLPQYYVPYADQRKQALAQSQPLDAALKAGEKFATSAEKYLAESGRKAADLRVLRLGTRRGWGTALIDAKTGDLVQLLPPPL
ncbi:MAG: TfpX/TfpZ family type IV pilin accessory protein [Burkholderiales bacterium]